MDKNRYIMSILYFAIPFSWHHLTHTFHTFVTDLLDFT